MTSRMDIWRAAKLLVDQHGANAAISAAQRADELLERGDVVGQAIWKRITAAVEELIRREPKQGLSLPTLNLVAPLVRLPSLFRKPAVSMRRLGASLSCLAVKRERCYSTPSHHRGAQRANELLAADDIEGRAVWFRLLGAVKELMATQPPGPVH